MDKIKFIEEKQIEKAVQKEPRSTTTNPIRANLMKFVHLKLPKNLFKKDFL